MARYLGIVLALIGALSVASCDSFDHSIGRQPDLVGSRSISTAALNGYNFPEDGLLAYFPFNGHASNIASTLHQGQIHGATFTTDRHGVANSAVQFDGVDDYITISESTLLQVPLPVSLSYWVKLDQNFSTSAAVTTSYNISKNTGVFAAFASNGGNPSISIGGGEMLGRGSRSTFYASTPLLVSEWYHVVGVVEESTSMRLYINGFQVAGIVDGGDGVGLSYDGPMVFGRRVATIGRLPIYFQGALDDVALYGKALSQREVTLLYYGSTSPSAGVKDELAN